MPWRARVEDYRVTIPLAPNSGISAADDMFTVDENSMDNVLDVLSNDITGPSGGAINIASVSEPANGTVTIMQGTGGQNDTLVYTPDPNFFGSDTFTYIVIDDQGGRDTATVSMTVTEVVGANQAPIANDDSFTVDESSSGNVLNILDNDSDPDGDPIEITDVSTPSGGGSVTITATGLLYTPALGFTGTETFTYTIQDPSELTDTATVTVMVNDISGLVRYRLEATDANGNVVSEILVGQEFDLNVYVLDLRDDAQGVFSAYLDVTYDSTLASVVGDFIYGSAYPDGHSGSTTTAGLIDEAGAIDGVSPLGADEKLLWSLPLMGDSAGTLFFSGDPADILPGHETTLFGLNEAVDSTFMEFANTSIVVNPVTTGVVDDMFSVVVDSMDNPLPVLANDIPPAGAEPFTLISVTDPANGSAMVSGEVVLYTPDPGYLGPDSFMYTVRDANNVESTANVSINVTATPTVVSYELEITDGNGNPIDSANVGETFQLMVFTNDLRDDPMGVFAGYLDVLYSGSGSADVSAAIEYGTRYPEGQEGVPMPGLIDELGAFDGLSPFGDIGRVLLANVTFTAMAEGTLDFTGEAADDLPAHLTLIFGEDDPVDISSITFGSDSLTINPGSSPFTNSAYPYDVDEDGFLTPRDALVIINDLAANGARSLIGPNRFNSTSAAPPSGMVDVNSDFHVSPVDALWVINEIAVGEMPPGEAMWGGNPRGNGLTDDALSDNGVVTTLVAPLGVSAAADDNAQQSETSVMVVATTTPAVQTAGAADYGHLVDAALGDGEEDESDWDSTLQLLALGIALE